MQKMKIAVLSTIAWRTPPRHYGPWEQVAYNMAKGLSDLGHEITLFATGESESPGNLESVVRSGYEEDKTLDAKVAECLHISHLMEMADRFDVIHNHFDFLPLTYSRLIRTPMVTTIHGFSSPKIVPVYEKYNGHVRYVSISDASRWPTLDYAATVYNGIDPAAFTLNEAPGDYLLFFGRICREKGTREAIEIARKAGKQLVIAGIIQEQAYFEEEVQPFIDGDNVVWSGSAGPEQRNGLLRNALALLHPISFEEPFGLSVAESMFCGTPVIAFRRGSMPELIKDGETGFLVSGVDEAVEKVNALQGLSRDFCREHAGAMFSLKKMAEGYAKVYEETAG
jgi:glycosyltransferase involved in cell wall biosynthesis